MRRDAQLKAMKDGQQLDERTTANHSCVADRRGDSSFRNGLRRLARRPIM
jgi:hypothetical protein